MNQNSESSTWSFTEFVQYQSLRFPHLTPLADFLTGQHSEPRWTFPWSRSQVVNVTVVDIQPSDQVPNPGLLRTREIRDIASLRNEVQRISNGLVARLFLVEDLVAPVADLLGSAFQCQPDFFRDHMVYKGVIWQDAVAEAGNNGGRRGTPMYESASRYSARNPQHFSIPYRRVSEDVDRCKRLQKQRSMFRDYSEAANLLEERVTGNMITKPNVTQVGILLFDSSMEGVFPRKQYRLWEHVPQYHPSRISAPQVALSTSMRDVFLYGMRLHNFGYTSKNLEPLILQTLLGVAAEECIEQNLRNQGLMTALTSIQEAREGLELTRQGILESKRGIELSQKAINQAENIQALTSLATFYILLSFVCSFFGMNISPLTGQSSTSLWVFFVVAIPLTLLSLMTVYHWERVLAIRQWLQSEKARIWPVGFFTRTGKRINDKRDEEQNKIAAP